MEKGEIAIVAGQFIALALVILILGNYFGTGTPGTLTPQTGNVYWGAPSAGMTLKLHAVTQVNTNANNISMYFTLAQGTTIGSVSASRLCVNPTTNNTGEGQVYITIPINYDAQKKQNYVEFGPTGQNPGIGCTYTITVTDSLQQTVTWVGTVRLNSTSSTSSA